MYILFNIVIFCRILCEKIEFRIKPLFIFYDLRSSYFSHYIQELSVEPCLLPARIGVELTIVLVVGWVVAFYLPTEWRGKHVQTGEQRPPNFSVSHTFLTEGVVLGF